MGHWDQFIGAEMDKNYMQDLFDFLAQEYAAHTCYPDIHQIFRAFDLCPFEKTQVVILGQDPYFNEGQANGLAFSVNPGQDLPPSLRNICKEIEDDTGERVFPEAEYNGDLSPWAEQGVLLLNTCLTVRAGKPASHAGKGWETFTDAAIRECNAQSDRQLIFVLWGAHARKKLALIDESRHVVLAAAHPSPLSAHNGFFKCRHFSQINKFLIKMGKRPINWRVGT